MTSAVVTCRNMQFACELICIMRQQGAGLSKVDMKNLAYRPDIEGLRCIAVPAVLVFHLDP